MKKKYLAVLLGMLLGAGAFSGCAATPESSLVKQKGKAAMKNYKSADDTTESTSENTPDGSQVLAETSETSDSSQALAETSVTPDGSQTESTGGEKDTVTAALPAEEGSTAGTGNAGLRERLGAPETYQSEVKDATGNLTITTDAKVLLPDAEKLNTITVTQHPFGQDTIDAVTAAFFPEAAAIYDGTEYSVRTILEESGYSVDDIEGWAVEEVKPQFGLSSTYPDGTVETADDSFNGVVKMADGSLYHYTFARYDSMPMEVKIERMEENRISDTGNWSDYDSLKAGGFNVPEEAELKAEIGISLEEAKQQADGITESLGFSDMALSGWEYQLKWENGEEDLEDATQYSRDRQQAACYLLHYTRKIDGTPVTYKENYGIAHEGTDTEMETWGYERLDISLSGRGLEKAEFLNQCDLGAVQTKNVQLLPFSDIILAYEKMMLVKYADLGEHEKSTDFTVDRIELGYGRIYEPSVDSHTGLLVPVWTFFGDSARVYESGGQETKVSTGSGPFHDVLCINAVDGSMINLDLGY